MIPAPKQICVCKEACVDRRRILPSSPVRPVLAKIPGIPELVSTNGRMGEDIIVSTFGEGGAVVVIFGEYHNVV